MLFFSFFLARKGKKCFSLICMAEEYRTDYNKKGSSASLPSAKLPLSSPRRISPGAPLCLPHPLTIGTPPKIFTFFCFFISNSSPNPGVQNSRANAYDKMVRENDPFTAQLQVFIQPHCAMLPGLFTICVCPENSWTRPEIMPYWCNTGSGSSAG